MSCYQYITNLDCPVEFTGYEVFVSEKDDSVHVKLILRSLSQKTINAIKLNVLCYDTFNEPVHGSGKNVFQKSLQELNMRKGLYRGEKARFKLQGFSDTRAIQIVVTAILFSDGSKWDYDPDRLLEIELQPVEGKELENLIKTVGKGAFCYAREDVDNRKLKGPLNLDAYWLCVCGRANQQETERCIRCERLKSDVLAYAAGKDEVDAELKRRETQQAEEAARRREKRQTKFVATGQKLKRISYIAAPLLGMVIGILLAYNYLIVPATAYNRALALFENGHYEEAEQAFLELNDYRNAQEMYQAAVDAQRPEQSVPAPEQPVIQVDVPEAEPNEVYVYVNTPALNMRSGPGTGYDITGSLTTGASLLVVDRHGEWLNVITQGQEEGWVHSDYVTGEPPERKTVNNADYYIDYENGTIPLGDLPIGARVVDPGWEWEYHTEWAYTREEDDQTKPVTWLVVAHDHYEGLGSHVTLLAEELIGRHVFDNSSHVTNWGYNHWGESGTHSSADRGLRPWLNSTDIHSGEGFYQTFSENFKSAVLTTTLPNKEWENGSAYSTQDKVFIPSTTELGDTEHRYTYQIGVIYTFFSGAGDEERVAILNGETRWYWTRSPASDYGLGVRSVTSAGAFGYGIASIDIHGVRPALNLESGILVSEIDP